MYLSVILFSLNIMHVVVNRVCIYVSRVHSAIMVSHSWDREIQIHKYTNTQLHSYITCAPSYHGISKYQEIQINKYTTTNTEMHLCITSALGYDGIALEGENTVGKSNKMRWTEILQYNRYRNHTKIYLFQDNTNIYVDVTIQWRSQFNRIHKRIQKTHNGPLDF